MEKIPLDGCIRFYCSLCGFSFSEDEAFYDMEVDIFLCPKCGEVLKCAETWEDYLEDYLEEIGGEEDE